MEILIPTILGFVQSAAYEYLKWNLQESLYINNPIMIAINNTVKQFGKDIENLNNTFKTWITAEKTILLFEQIKTIAG